MALFKRPEGVAPGDGGVKELIADGFRGEPDVDLSDYAAARGLEHRGNTTQLGMLGAMPLSEELQFNVLRGTLAGGEEGILFHEVKMYEEGTNGTFFGQRIGKKIKAGDLVPKPKDLLPALPVVGWFAGGKLHYFKCPATTAAIRLPEAQGPLVGLQVGRRKERVIQGDPTAAVVISFREEETWDSGPGHWGSDKLDDVGLPGWQAAVRMRGRPEVQQAVLAGPVRELLSAEQPLGFQITYWFGCLIVLQQHFLKQAPQLDALSEKCSWLAKEIRRICTAMGEPLPFATALDPPGWYAGWLKLPNDKFFGGNGEVLHSVAEVAQAFGMTVEDQWAFTRGFCDVGIPGEPFGVMRGVLPGTSVEGRIVGAMGRVTGLPMDLDKALEKEIGGPYGSDVVMFGVDPAIPDRPVQGEVWGGNIRWTVRRGILAAWRARPGNFMTTHEVQSLVADVTGHARSVGFL
jgi:hypothetical protein